MAGPKGKTPIELPSEVYQAIKQHLRSIEELLNPEGTFGPWADDQCAPTFDIVIEEATGSGLGAGEKKARLKFTARRGCVYAIRNLTGEDATVEFRDEDGVSSTEAKKHFDLAGDPPELKVAPNNIEQFAIKTMGGGRQKFSVTTSLPSGTDGGTGNGPNMEIDDP